MTSLSTKSLVVLIAAFVVVTPSASSQPGALPVAPVPASLVAPDSCPYDDASTPLATASAMCKYLEKCCAGGTDNAQKCCSAYLARC
jgi:hypothetical protein